MNDNQSTPPSTSWLDTLRSLPGKALQGIKRLMPGSSSSNDTGATPSTTIATGPTVGGRRRNRKSKKQATKKAGRRRGSRKSSRRS